MRVTLLYRTTEVVVLHVHSRSLAVPAICHDSLLFGPHTRVQSRSSSSKVPKVACRTPAFKHRWLHGAAKKQACHAGCVSVARVTS